MKKSKKESFGFAYKKVESVTDPYQVHVFEVISSRKNKIKEKSLKKYSCYNEESREFRISLLEKEGVKPLDYYFSEEFWCYKDNIKIMTK